MLERLAFFLKTDLFIIYGVEKDALLPLNRAAFLKLSLNHGNQFSVDQDSRLFDWNLVEIWVQPRAA